MDSQPFAIETRKLSLWYGTFQALFEVSLQIRQGTITSLIGPSGCGKSTFLRTVNRIGERLGYVRTSGEVEVLGENILPPRAAEVFAGERAVGILGSIAESLSLRAPIALALLRREAEPGSTVDIRWSGGSVQATVRDLPLDDFIDS